MILLAISPIALLVPVAAIAGITGLVVWARRKMAGEEQAAEAANDAIIDQGKESQATGKKTGAKCKRTGQAYDAARWHSPPPVIAALQKLGYPLNSLTNAAGRAEVIKFQTRGVELSLMGMNDAGPKWIDGLMGACTLVSLSAAMNMFEAGNWPGA